MGFLKTLARNWKTTAAGAITILSAIPAVGPYIPLVNTVIESNPQTKTDWLNVGLKIVIGTGLLAAKDGNVSGGSKKIE